MGIVFNGSTKTIEVSHDQKRVDIQKELYSRSVDWLRDNSMFVPPFESEGGGYLIDLSVAPMIFRFRDSWKIELEDEPSGKMQILRFTNGLLALQSDEAAERIRLKKNQYHQIITSLDNKFENISSHRQLERDIDPLLKKVHANDMKLGVIYFDIDDFKTLNTELTETVVDKNVLPILISIINDTIEETGFTYREGGDEFVCLIPVNNEEELLNKAEELRKEIEKADVFGKKVTASLGTSISNDFSDSGVLARANIGKSKAKENGKNRTEQG